MPMGSFARRPTVLIVQHQDHSTPGRVGVALKAMGARLDIRRPSCGEPLPEKLANHDGVVVFGGPMGANDSLDWVRREIDWLETPLAEEKPLLGLCLGAQMLARALGARVFRYDDKRSEIGYYAIEPTPAGERMCSGPFPRTVYQWHTDGFDLPGAPNSWPRAGRSSPTKRIAMAGIRSACNSTLK
jgi:GMP synthase (glutamine-hydrolysing)